MSLNKKYEGASVSAFIHQEGKVLVALRALDDDYLPDYWEQVGGKVDEGETLEQALIREVQEEAGVTVKPVREYNQFEYTYRDGRSMCEYAFICELVGKPEVTLSEEHQKYQWVTLKELSHIKPMSKYMREVIRKGFDETSS